MTIDNVWNPDKAVPFKSTEQYFCDSVRAGTDFVNFRDVNPANAETFDHLPIFSYSRNSCWSVINHVNDGLNDKLPQTMSFDLKHVSESDVVTRYFHVSNNPEDSNEPHKGVWLSTNREAVGVSESDYNNKSNEFIPLINFRFNRMRLGVRFVIAKVHDNIGLSTINVDSVDDLLTYDPAEYVVLETHTRTYYLNRLDQWGWNTNSSLNLGVICNINNETLISPNSFQQTWSDNNGLNIVPYGRWQIRSLADKWTQTDWIPRSKDTGFNWIGIPFNHTADDISCVQGDITPLGNNYNAFCYRFSDRASNPNHAFFAGVLTIEQAIKEIAFLGLYICKFDSPTENLYLGYQNEDGETTGELIPSKDWGKSDSLQIQNPEIKDFPDIHVKPQPGPTDDEKSEYGGAAWSGVDAVSIDTEMSYRIMTKTDMQDFRSAIERLKNYEASYKQYMDRCAALAIPDTTATKYWNETFPSSADYTAYIFDRYGYGSDPVNSIISIIAYPFELPDGPRKSINDIGARTQYISIPTGYTISGVVSYADVEYYIPPDPSARDNHSYPAVINDAFTKTIVNQVEITHPKFYTDFRAYAPYTRLELYIPMHGTIDLDPAVVMGKQLTVKISITLADGSSVATVLINNSIYQTINGQVGYSIPMSTEASSTNNLALKTLSAQSQSQRLNAIGNVIHGLASTATSIATGNYGSAAGSAVDMLLSGQQNAINNSAIKYQIEHATDGKIVIGQPSSLNAFLVHPNCQLIWHLPLMQHYDPAIYGKTVGYKCYKTAALGSLTGYTECSNAILDDVSCTEAEKAIILEQLKNGIII